LYDSVISVQGARAMPILYSSCILFRVLAACHCCIIYLLDRLCSIHHHHHHHHHQFIGSKTRQSNTCNKANRAGQ